ncbi:MAG: NADH:flavin oxidoreductase [Candidatus Aminicenantales bacterium]
MQLSKKQIKSILFSPTKIGGLVIPNRFVRSATHDFMAEDDGSITDRQVDLFKNLAQGEAGLIITGHAYVHPSGKASPFQIGAYKDELVEGLQKLTEAVHRYPSRIFLQLSHAGRQTKPRLCQGTPLAPSPLYEPTFNITPREMKPEEIEQTIDDFIQAGRRAKEAGFDGVQIHAAHGYLLSSFISPYTNRRQDKWGGNLTNRLRIVVEIIKGLKKLLGQDFPVAAKLNSTDFLDGGLDLEESVKIAQILEASGLDAVEVSGGMAEAGKGSVWKGIHPENEEGYFVQNAAIIKKAVSIPVFGLGGLRTFSVMEKIIKESLVDFISMSRPFIREPFLVKKFRQGQITKSECISCNKCFNLRGIKCAQLEKR